MATEPPGKEKIGWFRDYILRQIKQQRIKISLGHPATKKAILKGNPDVVILATGAMPLIPELPGIRNQFVCTAWEVLERKKKIKDKSVLVLGG